MGCTCPSGIVGQVFQSPSFRPATGRRIRKVSLDRTLSGRPELHCEAHVSSPSPRSEAPVGKDNGGRPVVLAKEVALRRND